MQKNWLESAYYDYAIKQLDIEQITEKYGKSKSNIWRQFDKFKDRTLLKSSPDKNINIAVDTTYFGRSYGYMIFRAHGVNLYYRQIGIESVEWLCKGFDVLEGAGYEFKSITIEGRAGFINYLKTRYLHTRLQYCQFHQKQTIKRYITNNPKTRINERVFGV
ncbi:MAG: hypothetical protein LBG46_04145 [Elusimicrobiota bacterium]|nr:hypothetical protein [Elusimicrobiota bacterium]